jgi:hypothetical protein
VPREKRAHCDEPCSLILVYYANFLKSMDLDAK